MIRAIFIYMLIYKESPEITHSNSPGM